MKKHEREETIMDMNAELSLLKVIREYTRENVCVNSDIETIRYELRWILAIIVSYASWFEFRIVCLLLVIIQSNSIGTLCSLKVYFKTQQIDGIWEIKNR